MSLSFEKTSFCYLPPKKLDSSLQGKPAIKHSQTCEIRTVFPEAERTRRNSEQLGVQLHRRQVHRLTAKDEQSYTIVVHKVESKARASTLLKGFPNPL